MSSYENHEEIDEQKISDDYDHEAAVARTSEDTRSEEYVLGGFWMRFWAYTIDVILVSSLSGVIAGSLLRLAGIQNATLGIYSLAGFLGALTGFVYFVLMTKFYRQTLGKMILGMRVVSVKRETLTWGDVIIREVFGRSIHQSLIITNALYLVVAFDSRKQGIHDKFADTAVVLEPRKKRSLKK
ncbi:RDD family protein [Alteribacter natronophilus]|uniref:RDD family protein n=1 Tax=Alteribacter natronophilus TaxID=2583810 RepID=UPI00110DA635|nr:RDD family protein [Alteribacter natronophilus]TMW71731.1 RDD family protein [Alteribacter natronophilus]